VVFIGSNHLYWYNNTRTRAHTHKFEGASLSVLLSEAHILSQVKEKQAQLTQQRAHHPSMLFKLQACAVGGSVSYCTGSEGEHASSGKRKQFIFNFSIFMITCFSTSLPPLIDTAWNGNYMVRCSCFKKKQKKHGES